MVAGKWVRMSVVVGSVLGSDTGCYVSGCRSCSQPLKAASHSVTIAFFHSPSYSLLKNILQGVSFIVVLSKPAVSNRKLLSTGICRGSSRAEGHSRATFCVIRSSMFGDVSY